MKEKSLAGLIKQNVPKEEIKIIIYLEHSPQNGQNSVKSETQTVLGAMYKLFKIINNCLRKSLLFIKRQN